MRTRSKFTFKNNSANNIFLDMYIWIILNEYLYYFDEIITIFQACLQKGIYIPRFCYHVKLKLAGNCRLCFVEDSEVLKPVISCSTSISDEMQIFTHTQLIFEARESVLEFLLINHPLDCPVCDQGGECDLQDQFMVFGGSYSRYYEKLKKNVADKNLSDSIKLSLNKCINCSRCTRYAQDVLSIYTFSLLGRGSFLEISNYNNFFFESEISGNVIDLCPVGAITSKFYSFINRYWELIDFKFIDIFENFNVFLRIDFSGFSLIRIIPLENIHLNEEWISDKSRFNFDGFSKFRILKCFIVINSFFLVLSWFNVINFIKDYFIKVINFFFIKKKKFFYNNIFLSSIFTDFYLLNFLKFNFVKLNYNNFLINNNNKDFRKNFYFKTKDIDFIDEQNFLFLGINLRLEFPILNIKLREKSNLDYSLITVLGFLSNLNYFFFHLGNNFNIFVKNFFNFENFVKIKIFVGYSFIKLNNYIFNLYYYIFLNIYKLKIKIFNFFSYKNLLILNNEINVCSVKKKNVFFFKKYFNYYYLNYSFTSFHLKKNCNFFYNKLLNLYQGSNFNFKINLFNVVMPSKLFIEKSFIYINIMGILFDYTYMFYKFFINNLKSDIKILKNIFEKFNLNYFIKTNNFKYFFFNKNHRNQETKLVIFNFFKIKNNLNLYKNFNIIINSMLNNYYLNDTISFCSDSMHAKHNQINNKNDYNYFLINKIEKWLF